MKKFVLLLMLLVVSPVCADDYAGSVTIPLNVYRELYPYNGAWEFYDQQDETFPKPTAPIQVGETFEFTINFDAPVCLLGVGGGSFETQLYVSNGTSGGSWDGTTSAVGTVEFLNPINVHASKTYPVSFITGPTSTGFNIDFPQSDAGGHILIDPSQPGQFTGIRFSLTLPATTATGVEIQPVLPDDGDMGFYFWLEPPIAVSDEQAGLDYPPTIFSVDGAIIDLVLVVDAINLASGISSALDAKLDNALDAYDAEAEGDQTDVIGKLEAFINSVEAQRDKKISSADADLLIDMALEILFLL